MPRRLFHFYNVTFYVNKFSVKTFQNPNKIYTFVTDTHAEAKPIS